MNKESEKKIQNHFLKVIMGDLIEVYASLKNVLLEVALFHLGNKSTRVRWQRLPAPILTECRKEDALGCSPEQLNFPFLQKVLSLEPLRPRNLALTAEPDLARLSTCWFWLDNPCHLPSQQDTAAVACLSPLFTFLCKLIYWHSDFIPQT